MSARARALAAPALVALAALAAGCGPRAGARQPAPAGPLTPAQIAERALPSVALIVGERSLGTGFVIWQDGRIATNLHVIVGTPRLAVQLSDGSKHTNVEVLDVDPEHDLAVIRVPARGLPALPLGDSDKVKPGERVVAIGHPLGLGNTVSDGLVSAIRDLDAGHRVLQISAPIAQGSSGGPLLNDRGEVIGVAFLVSQEGQNLNFAVPVNYLKPMLLSDQGMPFEEFARRIAPVQGGGGGGPKIQRQVPDHPVSLLDDCPQDQIEVLGRALLEAIKVGAPLYNQGNHEACFRIYEGTALELQSKLQGCKAAKQALADGVSRAAGLADYTAKAWAMRDAFDGLLLVIEKKLSGTAAP